ncbi:MAG TPA: DUF2079 domain-containing protein [Acidimicrobiales bacterium]|nr:DUF2079 domain-containing protein [Acidimicrobiales bacterium]
MVLPPPVRTPPPPDTADQVNLDSLIRWAKRRDPVRWALGAMILAWSLLFIGLGAQRHIRFGTYGFDLGIYDQAIWLLSRFETPFITLRGLDFWGTHANPVLVLFVPFYWVGAGPLFLLVVQVASQAAGAVAVFLLARDRLKSRWPAVVMAGVLLLHPTYQYLVWEFFHPDALALGPLLFTYWAARARRWKWFAVSAVLAVACKEDVALAIVVLGVLIAVRGDRRIGMVTSAVAAVWFMVATRVIIPFANGIGPFYDTFFGEFGSSASEVAKNVVTKPGLAFDVATRPTRMDYYRMMFAPVAFLPVFALPTLLLGAPMLGINVLSSFPYQQEIRYHYAALVLAAIILATVEGIAVLSRTAAARAFLVGLVAATSLAATVAWGPSPISTKYRSGLWALYPDVRNPIRERAVAMIPSQASASVHYNFAPHMTHRKQIYEWPAPWVPINWGVRGENLHDPATVDWLLIDRAQMSDSDRPILARLLSDGEFTIRLEEQGIVVAQRVRAPSP